MLMTNSDFINTNKKGAGIEKPSFIMAQFERKNSYSSSLFYFARPVLFFIFLFFFLRFFPTYMRKRVYLFWVWKVDRISAGGVPATRHLLVIMICF